MVLPSQTRIELTILSNFFHNEDYTRKVLPFLKEEYFNNRVEQLVFTEVFKFVEKYNNLPTKEAILIEISQRKDINEEEHNHLKNYIGTIEKVDTDIQWLLDTTEKFCKDRAVHNAV